MWSIYSLRFDCMVYTFICAFWKIKFFWLLMPSKSSGALKKDPTFRFLTFGYALKKWDLGRACMEKVSCIYCTTMVLQVELFLFVFGELKTPKRNFEINWPLVIRLDKYFNQIEPNRMQNWEFKIGNSFCEPLIWQIRIEIYILHQFMNHI